MGNRNAAHRKESLQDIMNMMARRVDGLSPPGEAVRGVLSEAEAYARHDPLLASLLKQYRDAQGRYEDTLRRNGAGDPMAGVAADVAESCDAAVETRLMELRASAAARGRAEGVMRDSLEALNASARYRDKLERYAREQATMDHARRRRKAAHDNFFWLVVGWWLLQQALWETRRHLARDFAQASTDARPVIAV